ncbi:MAG: hypothetical protein K6T87_16240 [Roseiflexus sp.]|jgi:hypothetical protein|nr:hypothetical protein [Roseiflexus sp.]
MRVIALNGKHTDGGRTASPALQQGTVHPARSGGSLAVVGAIILAAALLAGGLIAASETLFALAPAALGGVWVTGAILQREWTRAIAMPGLIVVAAGATFTQVAPLVPLAGLIMTLVAWRLADLDRRLALTDMIVDERSLRRVHFIRLLIVAGVAFVAGSLATVVRVEIGSMGALIAGVLAVVGLSRLVVLLRRIMRDA